MNYQKLLTKKIYLCGNPKVCDDISVFFKELNTIQISNYTQYPATSDSVLVICEFNDIKIGKFDFSSLIYGKDYIFVIDLIKLVDYTETFYCAIAHPNKKIIIFGTGFNTHKLILRNPNIEIEYFVDNDATKYSDIFYGKQIFSVDKLRQEKDFVVIVTPAVSKEIRNQLKQLGLRFGKDFYFYDANRYPLQPVEKIENTFVYYLAKNSGRYKLKVCVVGTGNGALHITNMEHLPIDIECYALYENKNISTFQGRPVINLNQVDKSLVHILTDYDNQTISYLKQSGCIENKDYFIHKQISNYSYGELLLLTICDTGFYKQTCDYVSRGIIINYDGDFAACSLMSKAYFGNLYNNSIEYLMKSIGARISWLSCVNRTYSFCFKICNYFSPNAQSDYLIRALHPNSQPEHCTRLNISYDPACNLTCPSCRNEVITKPFESDKVALLHEEVLEYLPNVERLLDSYGEMFVSKYMLELYFSDKNNNATVYVLCNGLLFNQKNYTKLKSKYKKINAYFSIDAATAETYSKLRRGGNFETIIKNLGFCKKLRQNGELNYLCIIFVVQKDNFREMADFVKLGQDNNCDKVYFKVLTNRVGWSVEEFIDNDVYNADSKYHEEFLEIAKNPVFYGESVHLPRFHPSLVQETYFLY